MRIALSKRRPAGTRRSPLVKALVAALLPLGLATPATVFAAAYATGGNGQYKQQILWLTWGGGDNGTPGRTLADGSRSSATVTVTPGVDLELTCTLANVVRVAGSTTDLSSYRPGSWSGDALDDLYNIGGTGGSNQLISGIMTNGATYNFRVNCTSTVGGQPFRVPGLVMADAESMNSQGSNDAPTEFLQASAIGTWNIVEMLQIPGRNYYARKGNSGQTQTIRFGPGGESGSSTSPGAITFLSFSEGAYAPVSAQVSMDFSIKGGGNTAIAIGMLVPYADFGDAPASYGVASHLIQTLDVTPDGLSANNVSDDINRTGFTLGRLATNQNFFIGSTGPDSENASAHSPDARGDDSAGIAGATEEDGIPAGTVIYQHQIGEVYRQTIPCQGTGTLAGWIDFDGSGAFDANERAVDVCNGTSATLEWTIPTTLSVGRTFVRLRYASNASEIELPTGTARDGEVEDHMIDVRIRADVFVRKETQQSTVTSGDNVTYTLTVGNLGESSANGTLLRDPVQPGLDCSAGPLTCDATGGAACPADQSVATLQGTGWTIPTLPLGGEVVATLTCRVTATGVAP